MRSSPILLVSRATCCTSFNRTGPGSDAPQRHLHRQDNMPHFTQPIRRKPRRITEMLVDTNLNHVSAIFNGNKRLSRDFRRLHCSKRPQCDRNESPSLPLLHKTTKGAAILHSLCGWLGHNAHVFTTCYNRKSSSYGHHTQEYLESL